MSEDNEWCKGCKEYDKEKHCCPRWNKVIRNTVEELKRERPKGKWINAKCSACGNLAPFWPMASTYYHTNYCPHCGADMREDT